MQDVRRYILQGTPIILVGAKSDLVQSNPDSDGDNSLNPKLFVKSEEAKLFAEKEGLSYIETSAKTGNGVGETFVLLANQVLEKSLKRASTNTGNGKQLNGKPIKTSEEATPRRQCKCTII